VLTQAFAAQAPKAARDAHGEPVAQGLVVNMIDQRVRKLTPEFMTYTMAKMGLWALTRTAAQALAPDIRVNAIGPGPTLQGRAAERESHFARQRAATVLGAAPTPTTSPPRWAISSMRLRSRGSLMCVDGGQHLAWQTPDVLGVE
jgi:NAD(P)-dependent dehydrogenase (short-subunit alcohol dehydrogenase family)